MADFKKRQDRIRKLIKKIKDLGQKLSNHGKIDGSRLDILNDFLDELWDEVEDADNSEELRQIIKMLLDLLNDILKSE